MQTLSWGIWTPVPWPGIKPRLPALGSWSLSHWTTWEIPAAVSFFLLEEKCSSMLCISHNYTYISSFLSLLPLLPFHPSRSSQSMRLASLCYTATSHQISILYRVVYICWYYLLHSPHSLPPQLCLQVHSLHMHLHSFPANRFINIFCLDSIHMH